MLRRSLLWMINEAAQHGPVQQQGARRGGARRSGVISQRNREPIDRVHAVGRQRERVDEVRHPFARAPFIERSVARPGAVVAQRTRVRARDGEAQLRGEHRDALGSIRSHKIRPSAQEAELVRYRLRLICT